jgi:branched-chain amino acid transport system ATP-binding protein
MILQIRDLHAGYGKSRILHGVSFGIDRGEIVSIVGRNGSGRSTTMKAIIGLVRPESGSILLDGVEQAGRRTFEIVRDGIAYVPEERQVFDNLSVEENLILGLQASRGGRAVWTIGQMYDYFPRLLERRSMKAASLSGGEQQMLTICRSLLGNPRIIMIDEPTEGLAPHIITRVVEVVEDIRRHGVAVVLVEQKLTVALRISDRINIIGHGQIVYSGTPGQLGENSEVRRRWLEVS